ncbi:MAG TPA: peptide chain release factor N(5)-glutamine methyltransferase [Bacteroidales bacterium]|nr:peptide chain release factor N(5)-glutamine methyltransferase [Bacteroidales bacterium]
MTNTTVKQITDHIKQELTKLYPAPEAAAITYQVILHTLNVSRSEIYLKPEANVPKTALQTIEKIIDSLKNYEPLQYVLGETSFYGLVFKVNRHVLIPRPETEELVDWIIKEHGQEPLRAIDLGTGSGCIAVTLAKFRPEWEIDAIDISSDALELARENAEINQAKVNFSRGDLLNFSQNTFSGKFDLILSNPPYVTTSQKDEMHKNVLDYEPHLALFAPGADPLVFYRQIAAFASLNLNLGGDVYVEINEALPDETASIFQEKGFKTQLRKDIFERFRMLKAYRHD